MHLLVNGFEVFLAIMKIKLSINAHDFRVHSITASRVEYAYMAKKIVVTYL